MTIAGKSWQFYLGQGVLIVLAFLAFWVCGMTVSEAAVTSAEDSLARSEMEYGTWKEYHFDGLADENESGAGRQDAHYEPEKPAAKPSPAGASDYDGGYAARRQERGTWTDWHFSGSADYAKAKAEAERSQQEAAHPKKIDLPVSTVTVEGDYRMPEKRIRALVPQLEEGKTADLKALAKELQLVNDTSSVELKVDFQPQEDNRYHATLKATEKDPDSVGITVSNTGNKYTGDWRTATSYVNRNFTQHGDTLGIMYVTSPGHWKDVKQAALSYRLPLPHLADSLTFTSSWSDVDLGKVYSYDNLLDLSASGKSYSFGLHYQHNITYTSTRKDILDFGIDYKKYEDAYQWKLYGESVPVDYDFNVTTATLQYVHNERNSHRAFTWDLGYTANLSGNAKDYETATVGSDKHFGYWHGGISSLWRLPQDWRLSLRLRGQYTSNNLISTEQIGAGGTYTVRGFDERVISADTGIIGNLELYTPEPWPNSRFLLFFDCGDLTNNNGDASFHHNRLASAGIGYRYETDSLSARLDYAFWTDDPDGFKDMSYSEHKRWNFMLSAKF